MDWDCKFINEKLLTPKLWKQYLLLRIVLKVHNNQAVDVYYNILVPAAERAGFQLGNYHLLEAGDSMRRFMFMLRFV